ncbi:WhiB family transcriptional regulator [Nocardiopsis dassonvillei]|uniref:WhiB family transcriptional regulator n=1 Tax=Nocardiopsis dassonvillei TaxID=2014 RepID=UPI00200EDCE2|nr:WhiB family transcriptional regulator [Nocardiopsis dassonvillei]MCK9872972.1 WhiB family transcriptional regulator [Nocardiopsis dassonvillei]
MHPDLIRRARCTADPDAMFVTGTEQNAAVLEYCRPCQVRRQCLREVLQLRDEQGVWGGLTERSRRALFKSFPPGHDLNEMVRAGEALFRYATGSTRIAEIHRRMRERDADRTQEHAA